MVVGPFGMVEWRLAAYRGAASADTFTCKVIQTNGKPILKLPERSHNPGLPSGWTPIYLGGRGRGSGELREDRGDLVRRPGSDAHLLQSLPRKWFGPHAGQPGTIHHGALARVDGRWRLSPGNERNPYKIRVSHFRSARI
jgi:hypothetical protein